MGEGTRCHAGRGGLLAIAALTGFWLISSGVADRSTPPQPSYAQAGHPATAGVGRGSSIAPLPGAAPNRIRIPSIAVDAPLTGLGLQPDGRLQVPPTGRPELAGWYREGTPPGARGTALIAGHVDHSGGPAVFYALGSVRPGALVEVVRTDGRTAVFTVDAVESFEATDFPDTRVYAPSSRPELRLITCGGSFSPRAGYGGNIVAFAHLTGTYGGA
ncbi:class F sortase [Streptomyces sp. NPDC006879]|uniref:class F sortase n=1 Tax=Streptomyces sp. NPDC006879 TaxID=3364767 RepID=UPI0036AD6087